MKNIFPGILIIGAVIASSSCKKCSTCTLVETGIGEEFVFADGDLITVTSNNTILYKGASFSQGDTFTIHRDSNTTVYAFGLQFQGEGVVSRTQTDNFCGKGKRYNDQIIQHTNNQWKCAEDEKKKKEE